MLNFLKNKKGFSLTELMVTMSIIGTLGTVGAAKFDNALAAARDANRKMNIKQVQTALELYYADHSTYPISASNMPTQEGWKLVKTSLEGVDNDYIANFPQDPMNKDKYVYKYWSDGQKFKITYELEDSNVHETQLALGL